MDSTNGKVCQSEVPKKRERSEREVEGGGERGGGESGGENFFE